MGCPGLFVFRCMFPAFLDLESRRAVVVGGGPVAASKLDGLLAAGADVTVVAPEIRADSSGLAWRCTNGRSRTRSRRCVVGGGGRAARGERAGAGRGGRAVDLRERGRRSTHATAYLGGVVRRGGVTVAISTGGRAPALAGLLREALDAWLPVDLDEWLKAADEARDGGGRRRTDGARRPLLLKR
jgi:uroporphyrin-III C-methyltransferase / precorrin-2 dehydrogenase / sirohydrochlorin ferrochelatase